MNNDEILSLIDQMKAQGLDEEKIMDSFYETFKEGKMDRKDLEALASALGYELVDDFKEDSTPDPIEGAAAAEGISKEEAEDLKEIKPEESKEEFEEKVEEAKEDEPEIEEKEEEKVEEESEEKEDSEDDERKEAMKLFDLD